MPEKPLVSICIPTYNRASMIARAVQSALNQGYQNTEIIVVDNASTDQTEEVISTFKDPRIRYVRNERNLGLFGNFNRCIEISHGEYIHILHSDDSIEPDFIQTCVEFLMCHPDVGLTFTGVVIESKDRHPILQSKGNADIIFRAPDGFRKLLSVRGFIPCPTVIARRTLYEKTGLFSLEYPYSSDYYQWLTVSRHYHIAYIHGVHVHYYQGEHSESYRLLFTSPAGYLDTLKIYLQLIRDLGWEKSNFRDELNKAFRRYIGDCFFAGFTRTGSMPGISPALFIGMAFSGWSIMDWRPLKGFFQKIGWLIIMIIAGICLLIPPLRAIGGRMLERETSTY